MSPRVPPSRSETSCACGDVFFGLGTSCAPGDGIPVPDGVECPRPEGHAPGNGAAIGGLKVTTEDAWFAARPSGTEDVYKIYAESFKGADHLAQVQEEAKQVVSAALGG